VDISKFQLAVLLKFAGYCQQILKGGVLVMQVNQALLKLVQLVGPQSLDKRVSRLLSLIFLAALRLSLFLVKILELQHEFL